MALMKRVLHHMVRSLLKVLLPWMRSNKFSSVGCVTQNFRVGACGTVITTNVQGEISQRWVRRYLNIIMLSFQFQSSDVPRVWLWLCFERTSRYFQAHDEWSHLWECNKCLSQTLLLSNLLAKFGAEIQGGFSTTSSSVWSEADVTSTQHWIWWID